MAMRMIEKNSRRELSWRVYPYLRMYTRRCLSRCQSSQTVRMRVQHGARLLAVSRAEGTSTQPKTGRVRLLNATATARNVRWPVSVLEVEAGREGARCRQSRMTMWIVGWHGLESASDLRATCCTLLGCREQWYTDCFRVRKAARSKRAWPFSRCGFAQRQLKSDRAG
ncbi:hypothetical protein DFH11DRAFT_1224492 [Phellopilus nigrolimitatus]|nr:hypothetical protein DFH11DRAFT_1224492 [Phellopilus nigrolimitatus]